MDSARAVRAMEKQARALLADQRQTVASGKVATALLQSANKVAGTLAAEKRAVLLAWVAWLLHGGGSHGSGVLPPWLRDKHAVWATFAVPFSAGDLALIGAAVRGWVRRVCTCNFDHWRRPVKAMVAAGSARPHALQWVSRVVVDMYAMARDAHPISLMYNVFPMHLTTSWLSAGLQTFFLEDVPGLAADGSALHDHDLGCAFVRMASYATFVVVDEMLEYACATVTEHKKLLLALLHSVQDAPVTSVLALCVLHVALHRPHLFYALATDTPPSWLVAVLRKGAEFRLVRLLRSGRGLAMVDRLLASEAAEANALSRFLSFVVIADADGWVPGMVDLMRSGLADVCVEALNGCGYRWPSARDLLDTSLVLGIKYGDFLTSPGALWQALSTAEDRFLHPPDQEPDRPPVWEHDVRVQNRFFASPGDREAASDSFFSIATKQQRWVRHGKKAWVLLVQTGTAARVSQCHKRKRVRLL